MIAAVAATSALGAMVRARSGATPSAELGVSLGSLAMSLIALRIGELAAYHGAEHKAIGGYEQQRAAAEAPREHPRCGTQLAIPLVITSALVTHAARVVAPGNPRLARAAGQLAGVVAATELTRASLRGRGGRPARAAARAGMFLQRHVTTREPTTAQLEVAEAAVAAALRDDATARRPAPRDAASG